MDAAEVVVPVPVSAVWGTGATAVERWAEGLRADLARLTAQLRQLQAEADAAERHLVGADVVDGPARGEDFLPLVDEMLAAARARVDAVLQFARGESSAVVSRAMEEAAGEVHSAGAGGAGGAASTDDDVIVLDAAGHQENPAVDPDLADASWRQLRDRVRQLAQRTRA